MLEILRSNFLKKLLKIEYKYFYSFQSGEFLNLFFRDIENMQILFLDKILDLVKNSLMFLVGIFILFYFEYRLGIIFLISLPFVIVINYFQSKRIKKIASIFRKKFSFLNTNLFNILSNFMLVKVYQLENFIYQKLSKTYSDYKNSKLKFFKYHKQGNMFSSLLLGIVSSIIFVVGINYVLRGETTLGNVIAFFYVFSSVIGNVNFFTNS